MNNARIAAPDIAGQAKKIEQRLAEEHPHLSAEERYHESFKVLLAERGDDLRAQHDRLRERVAVIRATLPSAVDRNADATSAARSFEAMIERAVEKVVSRIMAGAVDELTPTTSPSPLDPGDREDALDPEEIEAAKQRAQQPGSAETADAYARGEAANVRRSKWAHLPKPKPKGERFVPLGATAADVLRMGGVDKLPVRTAPPIDHDGEKIQRRVAKLMKDGMSYDEAFPLALNKLAEKKIAKRDAARATAERDGRLARDGRGGAR